MTKERQEKKDLRKYTVTLRKYHKVSTRPKRTSTAQFKEGFFKEDTESTEDLPKLRKQPSSNFPAKFNVYESLFPSVEAINSSNKPTNQTNTNSNNLENNNSHQSPNAEEQISGTDTFVIKSPNDEKTILKEVPNKSTQEANYINCDVRYFDFSSLAMNFDIILLDPPWRLRGSEAPLTKSMFTNCSFSLNYNTLSDEEIYDLDIEKLSSCGLLFLWVINSQLQLGMDCLQKWGYKYVNRIIWIKKTVNGKITKSQGYYFLHSSEMCLVGIKGIVEDPFKRTINRISNDIIFSKVRQPSQKPDELYHIIEGMMPGGLKLEIFARNHNLRPGWLSMGNQLGKYYDWDRDTIICDGCDKEITIGVPRYKAMYKSNLDLCQYCVSFSKLPREHFFCLKNSMEDMVFHEYFECNICKAQPIPGIRFICKVCSSFDVCEACYDREFFLNEKSHKHIHSFDPIEIPLIAGGLPVHNVKCAGCNTLPIIGYCFSCSVCKNINLCQKCFFMQKTPRNHLSNHKVEIFTEAELCGE